MNTETGQIRKATQAEMAALSPVERRKWVALTRREAECFLAKGLAFRGLWGRRIARGLTPSERERFTAMVNAFHETDQS